MLETVLEWLGFYEQGSTTFYKDKDIYLNSEVREC